MYSCYLFHLTLLETFEATFDSFVFFFIFGPESLEWSFDLRVCCFSDLKIVFQTIQTRLVKPGDFAPGDYKGTMPKFLQSFAGPFLMSQFYSKVNL